ncbi:MAG TPA: bifunctional DNA-formamidopyrimidine glycosylase/DNA-(apurinic or apyrimidinic site) lyase [Crenotrichaceae bacterium]|nr:bifunctional DNA-formamidopyrimidine glycosylase/DNA-(apurinic or apyrimidinic site) lyase [Crenotrichaceae bacterium]
MPELPEVETTRRGIEPHLRMRVIREIIIRQPSLRWPVPDHIATTYPGQTIVSVGRRGKYLLLSTIDKHAVSSTLLLHLGMSGSLRIVEQSISPGKHDHVDFVLDNKTSLRFHDPRRFGSLLECPSQQPLSHPLLKQLGPEPLSDEFSGDYLYQRSRNRRVSVKSFIMDSHVVVGLGNIYATETLYEAGIHPARAAGRISTIRYNNLAQHAKKIIANAITQGGTTLRDFVNAAGKPGYFQQQLKVYGRENKPCVSCHTPIRKMNQNQRSSWYCPHCQH